MEGALEFAEEVFQMPVRLGEPLNVRGLTDYVSDASYATSVGLLRFGQLKLNEQMKERERHETTKWWKRVQSWFKGEF